MSDEIELSPEQQEFHDRLTLEEHGPNPVWVNPAPGPGRTIRVRIPLGSIKNRTGHRLTATTCESG